MDRSSWNFGSTSMFVDFLRFLSLLLFIQDTFTKSWDETAWNRNLSGVPEDSLDPRYSGIQALNLIPPSFQEDKLCKSNSEE